MDIARGSRRRAGAEACRWWTWAAIRPGRSPTARWTWCSASTTPRATAISGARPPYLPTGIALFALSPDAGIPTQDSGRHLRRPGFLEERLGRLQTGSARSSLTPTDSLKEASEALEAGSVQYVAADAVTGLYAAHGSGLRTCPSSPCSCIADRLLHGRLERERRFADGRRRRRSRAW
ncbi:MAG: hypothetical protein ACLTDR_05760 [Adlercreutzia equolifaciens]